MLMFVWGLKLEKILKTDGSPSMYLVSSVLFVVPATNRAPVPEKKRDLLFRSTGYYNKISHINVVKKPKNINALPSPQKNNQ